MRTWRLAFVKREIVQAASNLDKGGALVHKSFTSNPFGIGKRIVQLMKNPARFLFVAALTACGTLSVAELVYLGTQLPPATRRIVRTATDRLPSLPGAAASTGSWPSFRGPEASGIADGQNLPDTWNVQSGSNVLWRTSIPGLSHSSPIV